MGDVGFVERGFWGFLFGRRMQVYATSRFEAIAAGLGKDFAADILGKSGEKVGGDVRGGIGGVDGRFGERVAVCDEVGLS